MRVFSIWGLSLLLLSLACVCAQDEDSHVAELEVRLIFLYFPERARLRLPKVQDGSMTGLCLIEMDNDESDFDRALGLMIQALLPLCP